MGLGGWAALGCVGRATPALSHARIWYLGVQNATKGNEWEGEVSSQASSRAGGRAGKTGARDKGGRTKVPKWKDRPLLPSGCPSLGSPARSPEHRAGSLWSHQVSEVAA